jgi:hypothetical protein
MDVSAFNFYSKKLISNSENLNCEIIIHNNGNVQIQIF